MEDLGEVLSHLPHAQDPNLLVGAATGDDAAVYRLAEGVLAVHTVDFFPPIVDDAYDFGAIAAVNAMSDVYAMGGKPLLALNIACFPEDLPRETLGRILQGAADAAKEAGVVIGGGHTVKDAELKFGMAVTGTVDETSLLTNAAARPGDALVLTKPIGTGVVTTAAKAQDCDGETLAEAVRTMRRTNRAASEAAVAAGARAATDVTGFGLVGHLTGMMKASGASAKIRSSDVPLLPGARELLERGFAPGGTRANMDAANATTDWGADLGENDRLLLCDAQTSGGLLIAVPQERLADLKAELAARGADAAIIGAAADVREDGALIAASA